MSLDFTNAGVIVALIGTFAQPVGCRLTDDSLFLPREVYARPSSDVDDGCCFLIINRYSHIGFLMVCCTHTHTQCECAQEKSRTDLKDNAHCSIYILNLKSVQIGFNEQQIAFNYGVQNICN